MLEPVDPNADRKLAEFNPAGAVITELSLEQLGRIKRLPFPCVAIGSVPDGLFPAVGSDDTAAMRMAIEHFQSLLFKRMAWVSYNDVFYAKERTQALREVACEYELPISYCPPAAQPGEAQRVLPGSPCARWLQSLECPIGLACVNDLCAWEIVNLCHTLGLRVPDDIAVLSLGDDTLLCRAAWPHLSSINAASAKTGRAAGDLLLRCLSGEKVAPKLQRVAPIGIVQRASTSTLVTSDPVIQAAVVYIRKHLREALTVKGLASKIGWSRRTMEGRFKAILGRTPKEEIDRQRVDLAKIQLLQTNDDLEEVAQSVGLESSRALRRLFLKYIGCTPQEFR
jgi:LacI family transcriptional regulator